MHESKNCGVEEFIGIIAPNEVNVIPTFDRLIICEIFNPRCQKLHVFWVGQSVMTSRNDRNRCFDVFNRVFRRFALKKGNIVLTLGPICIVGETFFIPGLHENVSTY